MGKRPVIIIVVSVVVIGVITGVGLSKYLRRRQAPPALPQNTQKDYAPVSACDVFVLEDAQALLGPAATTGVNEPPSELDDLQISSCSYTIDQPGKIQAATLTVRAPKTDVGATSNRKHFDQPPTGHTKVANLGDQAYWDPTAAELNVLKHDTWITIINGSSVNPADRTVTAASQMARAVIAKIP